MNFNKAEDNSTRNTERLFLFLVVTINLIIKVIPSALIELGNDEVYYLTYALFPDWSHFDHPPMVGLLIQLFSLNLTLQSELFLRAGALVLSSANILILFFLVRRIYSLLSAYFAVILYISSFYFNIISGLFILPDTPQIFFILLALFFLLPGITVRKPRYKEELNILLFGMFAGLAFLSKYHSLFLWFGTGLYILFHNRIWLRKPALYISVLITLVMMIPVYYWNYKNDFISFTFHGDRVGLFQNPLNAVSFMQFNLGQILYQNPVSFVVYSLALFKIFYNVRKGITEVNLLLLYSGIPLILVFTLFSVFRNTLPHWSGPAFICLIILSSEYLADEYMKKRLKIIKTLSAGLFLFLFVLIAGTAQIKNGIISLEQDSGSVHQGKHDFTLDMYGWKQAEQKFSQFLVKEGISEGDHGKLAIVSYNWYPSAHIDFYIARPINIRLFALGGIEKIHKYYWINKERKLKETDRIMYITDSRNYKGPEVFADFYTEVIPKDTITIFRNSRAVKYMYIYEIVGFKHNAILSSPHDGF